MDRAASEYYLWSLEGKPVSVHLNLNVVQALQPLVQPASGLRPLEHGGILLGRVRQVNDCYITSVDAAEVVACEHARGASWTLSIRDQQTLIRRIRRQHGSLTVIGWFRTHTRAGLYLDQHDFALFKDYFTHPSCVSLIVRPEDREAAFFFWEEGDIRRSSPYQTFPFIPQALGTRNVVAPAPVEVVAVPASPQVVTRGNHRPSVIVRRALYAAPIAAGLLAGFLWQPDIERRRSAPTPAERVSTPPERRTFTPPEPLDEQPVETAAAAPPAVSDPAPRSAQKTIRSKPVRKLAVVVPRPQAVAPPDPDITVQPPPVTTMARIDTVPLRPDSIDLPEIRESVREEKPSKVRRVIGSIPLFGFLKKKKAPKTEDESVVPRHLDRSVASALTSPEAAVSSAAPPVRVPDSGPRPRTAAPVVR